MGGDIAGAQVLVTGGTSGIGRAAATELAVRGATVMITARDQQKGQETAAAIRADAGVEVEVGLLDLSSLDSVRLFAAEFLDTHDRLDVLVNNAGGLGVTARAVHPGVVATNFGKGPEGRWLMRALMTVAAPVLKKATAGAAPIVLLATAPDELVDRSLYWVESKPAQPSSAALDRDAAAALWVATERLAGLKP